MQVKLLHVWMNIDISHAFIAFCIFRGVFAITQNYFRLDKIKYLVSYGGCNSTALWSAG